MQAVMLLVLPPCHDRSMLIKMVHLFAFKIAQSRDCGQQQTKSKFLTSLKAGSESPELRSFGISRMCCCGCSSISVTKVIRSRQMVVRHSAGLSAQTQGYFPSPVHPRE